MSAWPCLPLGDARVATLDRGVSWSKSDQIEDGVPVIGIPSIRRGALTFAADVRLPYAMVQRKLLRPGDILLVGSSGALKNVGRSAIVHGLPVEDVAFASFVVRVRPAPGTDARYLGLVLRSAVVNYERHVKKAADGKYNLQLGSLRDQEIPLPTAEEQRAIAAALGQLQRSVELEEHLITTAGELKRGAMEQLFTRGLSGRESTHDGYPENWDPRPFQELAVLHRGYDLPVSVRVAGDVPVIGSNGVVGYHNEAKRAGPGVVVGRSGTMGKSFFCEGPYWPLNTGLFVVDFKGNRPLFVHYFIQAFDFSPYVAGVSVPTLNRNLVHQVPVRVPSLDEQEEIAAILRAVDAATALHERKRALLAELFEALLHDLMTGSVRVEGLDVAGKEVW